MYSLRTLAYSIVFLAAAVLAVKSQAQFVSFEGLRVVFLGATWAGGDGGQNLRNIPSFVVRLRLENITTESSNPHQIAVAAVKVAPQINAFERGYMSIAAGVPSSVPKAEVTDAMGGGWVPTATSGLLYGENPNDWVILRPGGSTPVTIRFAKRNDYAPPFYFTAELKLFKFDGRNHQVVPVQFGPIEAEPQAPQPIYPGQR